MTNGLICGSLRENSYNRIIAQSLTDMVDSYQFIIVSPEYNSGMPGVLKMHWTGHQDLGSPPFLPKNQLALADSRRKGNGFLKSSYFFLRFCKI
nr:hypothetical protein [Peribacillus frigoritolerans]